MADGTAVSAPLAREIVPGVTVTIGGADWVVAPLRFKHIRPLMPQIEAANALGAAGYLRIDLGLSIILSGIQINYPERNEVWMLEVLTMPEVNRLMEQLPEIMKQSGFNTPGEALAGSSIGSAPTA